MKKLLIILGSIAISAVPVSTLMLLENNANKNLKVNFFNAEEDFLEHKIELEEYIKVENPNYVEMEEILSKAPSMIYKVYDEKTYDNYMNTVYMSLSILDELSQKNGNINEINRAKALRREIENSNLKWREELSEEEYIEKINELNINSIEIMQNNYYAYNIGITELLSTDINNFADSKIELAGLREDVIQHKMSLETYGVYIKQYDTAVLMQKSVKDIFDEIINTIETKVDFIRTSVNPFEWPNMVMDTFVQLINDIVKTMEEYFSETETYNENFEAELIQYLKDDSNDNQKEIEDMAGEIFDDVNMGEPISSDDSQIIIDKCLDYLINILNSGNTPIYGFAWLTSTIIKSALYFHSLVFSNMYQEANFLNEYVLNRLPNMFKTIQSKYAENPIIIGEQIIHGFSKFNDKLIDAMKYVMEPLTVHPLFVVRNVIDSVFLGTESIKGWTESIFIALGTLDIPLREIKNLREDVTKIDPEVTAKYEESLTNIFELNSEIENKEHRISELEDIIQNSKYDFYIEKWNLINSKLSPFNDILYIEEIGGKNILNSKLGVDPIKNLRYELNELKLINLQRNNKIGKFINLDSHSSSSEDIEKMKDYNDRMNLIFNILVNEIEGII